MIRTVLGDLDRHRDRLALAGNILTHEHVMCASTDMLCTWKGKWPSDRAGVEEMAVRVYGRLKEDYGVSLIVDGTPCDLGRDVELIRRVSERAGVHFAVSSGLYHFPSVLTCGRTSDELAAIFIEEARSGIGESGIRPGILKCAVDGEGMTPHCRKRIRALAITRRETGLPLYVHCRFVGDSAHEVLDILEAEQANTEGVILGHATGRLDADYLEGLLRRGCFLGFDQCFAQKIEPCAQTVAELCRRGYARKLLLSLDYSIYNDFLDTAHTGLDDSMEKHLSRFDFLFSSMLPAFQRTGVSEAQCRCMLTENPLDVLDAELP